MTKRQTSRQACPDNTQGPKVSAGTVVRGQETRSATEKRPTIPAGHCTGPMEVVPARVVVLLDPGSSHGRPTECKRPRPRVVKAQAKDWNPRRPGPRNRRKQTPAVSFSRVQKHRDGSSSWAWSPRRGASLPALRHGETLALNCSQCVPGADEGPKTTRELGIRLFATANQMIKLQYGKPYTVQSNNPEEPNAHLPWQ